MTVVGRVCAPIGHGLLLLLLLCNPPHSRLLYAYCTSLFVCPSSVPFVSNSEKKTSRKPKLDGIGPRHEWLVEEIWDQEVKGQSHKVACCRYRKCAVACARMNSYTDETSGAPYILNGQTQKVKCQLIVACLGVVLKLDQAYNSRPWHEFGTQTVYRSV